MTTENILMNTMGFKTYEKKVENSIERFDDFMDFNEAEYQNSIESIEFINTFETINNLNTSAKLKMLNRINKEYGHCNRGIENYVRSMEDNEIEGNTAKADDNSNSENKPENPEIKDKQEKWYQKVWSTIKKVVSQIWKFIVKIFKAILRVVTFGHYGKEDSKKTKENLENIVEETKELKPVLDDPQYFIKNAEEVKSEKQEENNNNQDNNKIPRESIGSKIGNVASSIRSKFSKFIKLGRDTLAELKRRAKVRKETAVKNSNQLSPKVLDTDAEHIKKFEIILNKFEKDPKSCSAQDVEVLNDTILSVADTCPKILALPAPDYSKYQEKTNDLGKNENTIYVNPNDNVAKDVTPLASNNVNTNDNLNKLKPVLQEIEPKMKQMDSAFNKLDKVMNDNKESMSRRNDHANFSSGDNGKYGNDTGSYKIYYATINTLFRIIQMFERALMTDYQNIKTLISNTGDVKARNVSSVRVNSKYYDQLTTTIGDISKLLEDKDTHMNGAYMANKIKPLLERFRTMDFFSGRNDLKEINESTNIVANEIYKAEKILDSYSGKNMQNGNEKSSLRTKLLDQFSKINVAAGKLSNEIKQTSLFYNTDKAKGESSYPQVGTFIRIWF